MRLVLGGVGVRLAILAGLLVLAPASTAQAAQRFAAPSGSGTSCTQVVPCSVTEAVNKAQTEDEVIIGTGTYAVSEALLPPASSVDVHGDFAAPMPVLKSASPGPLISSTAKGLVGYLEVDNLAEGAVGIQCVYGRVERVRAKASGNKSVGLAAIGNCLVRDSVLLADGAKSKAYLAEGYEDGTIGTARNVTAVASGPESTGIHVAYGTPASPGSFVLDLRNAIADGTAADVEAAESPSGSSTIIVGNSNFDRPRQALTAKITDAGGNQAAAPQFVNAAASDYREAAGSPTIDAGVANQLGAQDLAGSPRVLGPAVDMGALEFVGEIQSLAIAPKTFRAAKVGEAITSAKKKRAPVGGTVTYSLSGSAATYFFIERKTTGRRVKGKCVKATKANRAKKTCPLFRQLKSTFARSGVTGQNKFRLTGRLGGKALKPGTYRLVATTSTASLRAGFRIVK